MDECTDTPTNNVGPGARGSPSEISGEKESLTVKANASVTY